MARSYTRIDTDFRRAALEMVASADAFGLRHSRVRAVRQELNGLLRRFERLVWFRGLRELSRGLGADERAKLLSKRFAVHVEISLGHALVWLSIKDEPSPSIVFSFDLASELPTGGIAGAEGELDDLDALVRGVIFAVKHGKGFQRA